jgi:carbonic anhydrase
MRILAAGSVLALATPALAASDGEAWGYSGKTGPEHWGELADEFATCKAGLMQSPVDLPGASVPGEIEVTVDWSPGPLSIQRGKTIQANFAHGSYMTSSGKVFRLVQVHFHTPSEHTIDGDTLPLVAHFVHASHAGELAVLGVLFEEGDENDELQKLIDAAADAGAEARDVAGVTFDPAGLLPDDMEVFRYMGSLTTPPCSEGVNWHVLEETMEAGAAQISAMEEFMGSNARPVQPLNGRLLISPE